ncbi:MAG: (d)CMP kinase [Eubacteriales bacterium]|nr:(d)CMP kinase [Eubacteriales bacterium]
MMSDLFSVAIDGPSGAGKSTLSKRAAAEFGFVYVDTGAIYRTVGLACSRKGVDLLNEEEVAAVLSELKIDIRYDSTGLQRMILNEEDVSDQIRTPEISMCASKVSSLPTVRAFLLDMQRGFARKYSVIMDGRDIGTVVLPDASLKIYLTAAPESRAKRRFLELQEKGIETSFESVLEDIIQRDYQDTHRAIAPLKKADDAVELDTSELDFEESFRALCSIISNHKEN